VTAPTVIDAILISTPKLPVDGISAINFMACSDYNLFMKVLNQYS
jgi:hypothetical protein